MSKFSHWAETKRERFMALWRAVHGNGCTAAPDFTMTQCCNRHDKDYRTHTNEYGRRISRAESDMRMFKCMRKAGGLPLAIIYYAGVRIFGSGFWKRKTESEENEQ